MTVEPGPLAEILEGASRPGHFRGVLTVVAKLFGLVQPDVAVFGEKDYQQLALIRRMVTDLCLPVEVIGAETQREPDGLAMSSRNRYLDPEQRLTATALSRTLRAAQAAACHGEQAALAAARAELRESPGVDLDYFVVTDADLGSLPADPTPGTRGRALIAAKVGTTRLIDNLPVVLGVPAAEPHSPSPMAVPQRLAAPEPGLDHPGRRRRHRFGDRRSHRGPPGPRSAAPTSGSWWSPRTCSTRGPPNGRRVASPQRWARATPPMSISATPWSRAPAPATRRRYASW